MERGSESALAPPYKPMAGWRLLSPTTFFFCLVILPMPWMEVRCNFVEKQPVRVFPPPGRPAVVPGVVELEMESVVLITQSGMQSIYGGYSWGPHIQGQIEVARLKGEDPAASAPKEACDGAPLMAVYAGLILVGLIFTAALPFGHLRLAYAATCGMGAILVLALQTWICFPLISLADLSDTDNPLVQEVVSRNAQGARILPRFSYTPFFYMAWAFTAGTVAMAVFEWLFTYGPFRKLPKPAEASQEPLPPFFYLDEEDVPQRPDPEAGEPEIEGETK